MLLASTLAGCSNAPLTRPDPDALQVSSPPGQPSLPPPEPLDLAPLEWTVVTRERLPAGDFVLVALTPRQYESLARNTTELLRWVREARYRVDVCRREDP